ncbi:putative bifunctional diguanylate cyclase/phosphodiesterase [Caulobacter sp. NIBR2454]|uniref:putative bifunctional diguanylate cyclase/phosphodiesterase n=1 Tax=Caulobacter sp. NIBR2454 TaxID=3015996 RepID=UPI0022B61BB9|nr:bifunctional diguanylate cyclase/phosphodiesterase [Caulobacter sp. NIBR2454]
MALKQNLKRGWDASAMLEALGAADVALWVWEPEADRLRLNGPARALGLGPLAPECASAAILALAIPQDRAQVERMLRTQAPGSEVVVRVRMRGAESCLWRGVWLEEGVRAAGVVAPETKYAASQHDQLTGLLDRSSFIARARDRMQSAGEYEMVVADLDRLRRLNEALGHERADLVLAALGSRLAAAFPPNAVIGRIGEDEFAVLIEAVSGREPAEMLRQAVEQPLRVVGFDIFPTLSLGAVSAEGGENAPEATELLRRAELAVEAARMGGRGGAAAYGRAMESDGLSQLALEADLRGALGRGEIIPFFQPVVRLSDGALAGFEALARWRHPRRGFLPPDDFLPLVEEMGLMSELGGHMVRAAATQLAAWRRTHSQVEGMTVSVNLSTGEIDRASLIAEVASVIKENDLPPAALKLEITESEVMRDPKRAASVLNALRATGVGLALDDFGTGFSSLSYLSQLPVDTLKIDRYFVRTMAANEGSAKIVRSIVQLGRDLDLEVVGEGVENAAMAAKLLELGCDYGQGFGYAPALPATEAEVYLNEAYLDGVAPLRAWG